MIRFVAALVVFTLARLTGSAQTQVDSLYQPPKFDSYQIYLKQPAKEIHQLLYEKDCTPINGNLSESKKTIIMQGYEPGNKVHIKVTYVDGTEDEFVRSPCYIDPVIL